MRSYKYLARDRGGAAVEGILQGASQQEILAWLRERNYTPVSVETALVSVDERHAGARRLRTRSQDLAALCWQLNTMIEGGVPITEAIDTISNDIDNRRLQTTLLAISRDMKAGHGFSESVAKHPRVFSSFFCAMILAGETSGTLSLVLRRLAKYYDERDLLARKVRRALAYPAFVVGFVIVIIAAMMTFIIPRFMSIFDELRGKLPAFTRGFMDVYTAIMDNAGFILIGVAVAIVGLTLSNRTPGGHAILSRALLRIPLVGKVMRYAFVATFCRTMSTLLSAGVSVLDSLELLQGMSRNDEIKSAVNRVRERLVRGEGIAASMNGSPTFPNLVVKMAQVGEDSGSLPAVFDRTSEYYERKVDSAIATMVAVLEPALIVSVGAIVLVVLLALYLPIFSLSDITM